MDSSSSLPGENEDLTWLAGSAPTCSEHLRRQSWCWAQSRERERDHSFLHLVSRVNKHGCPFLNWWTLTSFQHPQGPHHTMPGFGRDAQNIPQTKRKELSGKEKRSKIKSMQARTCSVLPCVLSLCLFTQAIAPSSSALSWSSNASYHTCTELSMCDGSCLGSQYSGN